MTITFDSKAYKVLIDKPDAILAFQKAQSARQDMTKNMSDADVMQVTGLSKSSLKQKRAASIFRFSSATGRNLQYLRSHVEAYVNGCPHPSLLPTNL